MNQENRKTKKFQRLHKETASYLKFTGMGFQMIAVLLLAYWGGRKLDAWLGDGGVVWTVVLLLVAVVGTMLSVIVQVMKGKD
ncbi:MAG: AtpZ/AtpI family protein [Cytophagales bacterium]|nr:AtpZ/AtpI family protein [Cytophagales bacterium]